MKTAAALFALWLGMVQAPSPGHAWDGSGAAENDSDKLTRDDEILAERGEMRLLLTGSCGEAGRHGVLQNRHPTATIRATVESSTWIGGRFRSSRRLRFTLSPGRERQLGCTEMSASVEVRFALVEVSNASRAPGQGVGHGTVEAHEEPPARDSLAFVESGYCGRDHDGRTIVVVNESGRREIAVTIEQVLKVDGRPRTRTLRHLRLAPGDQQELGCSRDGRATFDFELLEARHD